MVAGSEIRKGSGVTPGDFLARLISLSFVDGCGRSIQPIVVVSTSCDNRTHRHILLLLLIKMICMYVAVGYVRFRMHKTACSFSLFCFCALRYVHVTTNVSSLAPLYGGLSSGRKKISQVKSRYVPSFFAVRSKLVFRLHVVV